MPLFYLYPKDKNTFSNDLQFFYGNALLVSPVTEEGKTSVDAYFPNDLFYDWYTGQPVRGEAKNKTLSNIDITHIPLHVRGGNIIPLRTSSAMTTTELRKKGFELLIAPGLDGTAKGSLYVDDGDSLEQKHTLQVNFEFKDNTLSFDGVFDLGSPIMLEKVTLLGQTDMEMGKRGADDAVMFDGKGEKIIKEVKLALDKPASIQFGS